MAFTFLLLSIALGRSCNGAEADNGKVRAAMLDVDSSPLGALLEQRLLTNDNIQWVERNEIERILKEQDLSQLLGAATVSKRVNVGRLLKADLLVILKHEAKPEKHVNLVVCETSRGLRLLVDSLPTTDDPEADALELDRWVKQAMRKHREVIETIVAVPPFISNSLAYEYDHLSTTYAKLAEQLLLKREGLLVVELGEAQAIAREAALGDRNLERQLPHYLLGEYRHERDGDRTTVTIRLQLKKGDQSLGDLTESALAGEQAARLVRDATSKLIDDSIAGKRLEFNPKLEAEQLLARAGRLIRVGAWREAATLLEASILLDASKLDARRQVILAYGYACTEQETNRKDPVRVRQDIALYFRGLEHVDIFLRTTDAKDNYQYDLETGRFFRPLFRKSFANQLSQWASPEVRELAVEARKKEMRILLDIVRLRARLGCGDERRFFAKVLRNRLPQEQYSIALRMILELQNLPNAEKRTYALSSDLFQLGLYKPEGEKFLAQLRALGNKEVQAGARAIEVRAEELRKFHERTVDDWVPPTAEDSKHVRFRRVRFLWPANVSQPKSGSPFSGYLPLDNGDDVAWFSQHLFLVQRDGELKKIWDAGTTEKVVIHIHDVQYDGRYLWVSTRPYRENWGLFIVDTNSGQSWPVKEEDGLPRVSYDTARDNGAFIRVAPLSPGKALVISWFGRTAMALASFNPRTGARVEIFHEARETGEVNDPQAWMNDKMAFSPEYVAVSKDPADSSRNRVLVGRRSNFSSVTINPLVVQPHEQKVHVLSRPAFHRTLYPMRATITSDGIYQLETQFVGDPDNYDDDTLALCRIAPPEYKVEVIRDNMPEGFLLRSEDRMHIIGKQWWTLAPNRNTGDLQLSILAKQLPWFYIHSSSAGRAYDQAEALRPSFLYRPLVKRITKSNHFGILVLVRQKFRDRPYKYVYYQVELLERTEDQHTEPSIR